MKPLIRMFVSALFVLTLSSNSSAGDFAEREIYGFSVDGGLFAFEEYGVQDGSGFAYANLYVIDTATDKWTAGSPFRVRLEDDTKTVFDAREQARILAGPVMKSFENRGTVVATNRPTELVENPKRMVANPRLVVPPIDQPIEFRLKNLPMVAASNCDAFGQSVGYKLTQIGIAPEEQTKILHQDSSVPSSRRCPLDYQFADIVTYYPEGSQPVMAILILMKKVGFEGPDGRYLAVTGSLN